MIQEVTYSTNPTIKLRPKNPTPYTEATKDIEVFKRYEIVAEDVSVAHHSSSKGGKKIPPEHLSKLVANKLTDHQIELFVSPLSIWRVDKEEGHSSRNLELVQRR